MSSTNPHSPRRVNATIKHPESKRYASDNPWLTFEGSVADVREQVIEAFGMDAEKADGMSLADVVSEAQTIFTAMGNAKHGLGGGKVISEGSGGNAWDSAKKGAPKEKEPEENPVITAINGSTTVAELQTVWAENQEAFSDDAIMAAYKAKGKALQEAGA